ncbi:MAG: site-specific integrase [Muribaculaceae bacterium]|nr:site-specific integrase [Muribaculaceae bacterium]
MTFNEIWDEYISHKRKRVKPSTVSNYSCNWKMINDFFGDKEISTLTTKMVEKWVMEQLDSVDKKTIKDRLTLVNNIIDYYVYEYEAVATRINMKYIHWPTRNVFKGEVEKIKTFTTDDIRAMLLKIAGDPSPRNILVSIMIGTGIRIGEACALVYGSINLENGTIEITGTLERITIDDKFREEDFKRMNIKVFKKSKRSALILSSPKCVSSCRAIPVPVELLKILKKFKEIYPPAYYIGTNKFTPVEPRTLRKHYYELLESTGIDKKLSPHSLRHTYATTLITSGVDIKTTAALLGHGDTSTTLEIYSHATVESKKKAMTTTIGKQFKANFCKKLN